MTVDVPENNLVQSGKSSYKKKARVTRKQSFLVTRASRVYFFSFNDAMNFGLKATARRVGLPVWTDLVAATAIAVFGFVERTGVAAAMRAPIGSCDRCALTSAHFSLRSLLRTHVLTTDFTVAISPPALMYFARLVAAALPALSAKITSSSNGAA